jgi:hypothetical protein
VPQPRKGKRGELVDRVSLLLCNHDLCNSQLAISARRNLGKGCFEDLGTRAQKSPSLRMPASLVFHSDPRQLILQQSVPLEMHSLFLSAFGFSLEARECVLLRSSLFLILSRISLFSLTALCTDCGTCRRSLTDRTSPAEPHLSTSFCLYSIALRSLTLTGPSFCEAWAFQIRTLPSSEAERTKSAVGV